MFSYPYLYFDKYYDYCRTIYRITVNTKNHSVTLYKDNKILKTYKVMVGKPNDLIPTSKNLKE